MAEQTNEKCANCGAIGLYWCDNMFTDWYCSECGATNLNCRVRGGYE